MNQIGRDALRAAGLAGVPQIIGRLREEDGGRCGLGVLFEADPHASVGVTFDLLGVTCCPLCERGPFPEWGLMSHLNDEHRCDFFKIASLMPVSEEHAP